MCRAMQDIAPFDRVAAQLQALGIHTVGDIAAHDRAGLVEHFGRAYGRWLWDAAHGIDERLLVSVAPEGYLRRMWEVCSERVRCDCPSHRRETCWWRWQPCSRRGGS